MSWDEMERAAAGRPLRFSKLSPASQWDVDASLGVLDWASSQEEKVEYVRRRREMGDPDYLSAIELLVWAGRGK